MIPPIGRGGERLVPTASCQQSTQRSGRARGQTVKDQRDSAERQGEGSAELPNCFPTTVSLGSYFV